MNAPHQPLTRVGVSWVVTYLARRAGIEERVGAHRLRHSAATAVLAGGGTLAVAGQLLRRRSAQATAIYAKTDQRAWLDSCGPGRSTGRLMSEDLRARAAEYLPLRRVMGYQPGDQEWLIREFLDHLDSEHASTINVSRALIWACLPQGATPRWRHRRLAVVRFFAAHVQACDPQVAELIPPGMLPARVLGHSIEETHATIGTFGIGSRDGLVATQGTVDYLSICRSIPMRTRRPPVQRGIPVLVAPLTTFVYFLRPHPPSLLGCGRTS